MKKNRLWARDRRQESGQVEVETAIILPMVVFLLLGLIQLGLLHQARIFAKYAAYRAVRTGSLRVDPDRCEWIKGMEYTALAACLPIVSRAEGIIGGPEIISFTGTATDWRLKWVLPGFGNTPKNSQIDLLGFIPADGDSCPNLMPYTDIDICGPLKEDVSDSTYSVGGTEYVPFDLPDPASGGIKTKLRIQLTLNYRMIIPFADWVIYRMTRGWELVQEMHMGEGSPWWANLSLEWAKYDAAAGFAKVFIIPIRVQYSMKMHSDIPVDHLPDDSECM